MTDLNKNIKIENHGVIPKEEEQATPEELYARLDVYKRQVQRRRDKRSY